MFGNLFGKNAQVWMEHAVSLGLEVPKSVEKVLEALRFLDRFWFRGGWGEKNYVAQRGGSHTYHRIHGTGIFTYIYHSLPVKTTKCR